MPHRLRQRFSEKTAAETPPASGLLTDVVDETVVRWCRHELERDQAQTEEVAVQSSGRASITLEGSTGRVFSQQLGRRRVERRISTWGRPYPMTITWPSALTMTRRGVSPWLYTPCGCPRPHPRRESGQRCTSTPGLLGFRLARRDRRADEQFSDRPDHAGGVDEHALEASRSTSSTKPVTIGTQETRAPPSASVMAGCNALFVKHDGRMLESVAILDLHQIGCRANPLSAVSISDGLPLAPRRGLVDSRSLQRVRRRATLLLRGPRVDMQEQRKSSDCRRRDADTEREQSPSIERLEEGQSHPMSPSVHSLRWAAWPSGTP